MASYINNYESEEQFTMIFNTGDRISGNNYNAEFQFDWSLLPDDKEYLLSFTTSSQMGNTTNQTDVTMVTTDFLSNGVRGTYPDNILSNPNQFMGVLFNSFTFDPYSFNGRLTAFKNQNVPIYIGKRPQRNNFFISMRNSTTGAFSTLITFELQYFITFTAVRRRLNTTLIKQPKNLMVNSANNLNPAPTVKNDCLFNQFVQLDENQDYEVYITFVTSQCDIHNGDISPVIETNLFYSSYNKSAKQGNSSSNTLAISDNFTMDTQTYCFAMCNTTNALRINSGKLNTTFWVKLIDPRLNSLWLDGSGVVPNWILTFFFQPIDE